MSKTQRITSALWVGVLTFPLSVAKAGLTDATQVFPTVPGGVIGKPLEQQVGTGQGDVHTPGSSVYLIKRDPFRSIRRGRQLFQRKFTREQGQGPRVDTHSSGDIMVNPALGAGLSDSCAGCHGRPRGAAGFGGDVVTRPDSRDAPHLFGLGLMEMLADEITYALRRVRSQAVHLAGLTREPVTLPLVAKGVEYGVITATPGGDVDTSGVVGVDPDLRIRPFFAQGGTISIREFVIGALNAEMGLQAWDPVLCAATDAQAPQREVSPSGMVFDPDLDTLERPPACEPGADADNDGVTGEIDPALVDYLEFYLLNYFKPATGKMTQHALKGLRVMKRIGCTHCHRQSLVIEHDRRVADVETRHDPAKGIFNRLFASAETLFETVDDGEAFPLRQPTGDSFVVENIFTDLKRHDLGPAFHERQYDGSLVKSFMTEPLWGVGSTSPYGHDGRSITLEEVILRHGGEARGSRDAFSQLSENRRRAVLEFLQALVLFPPDDTASNLNPGVPGTQEPQDPSQHGSIDLGTLFMTDVGESE